jgi:lipopolysaccharide export LptBFGC system permease protein LptF
MPRVRILSHYFVGRFLGLFAMVLAVAFLLLATIELVLNLDDVSAFDAARSDPSDTLSGSAWVALLTNTLRYLALRLTSYYLRDLLPIASFIAVFLVFAIAGRGLERIAIEAGGIRPFRIVLPVLTAALILSLGTAILHETVILRAEQIWSGESHHRTDPIDFGRDAFWVHQGATITNVAHADPETRTLHDVEIFERSAAGLVQRVVRADRVRIDDDGRWQIENARVWHFDPEDDRAEPRFENVPQLVLDLASLRGDMMLGADPGLLPLRDLAGYLERSSAEPSSVGRRARARFHERLSSPWLVFVFALGAMPFGLRIDGRDRMAGPAVAAVVALALYFLAESAGRTLARQDLVPVAATPWAVMGLTCLLAAIATRRSLRSR